MSDFSLLKDKIPPHNLEAEQATLGAMLIDWEAVSTVTQFLRPENFYSPQNQKIFSAILDLFNKGNSRADLITLTNELRSKGELEQAGGPGYLVTLTNAVPTSANVEYYAKIVLEQSVRRDLIKISNKIIAQAYDASLTSRGVLEEAQKLIFDLTDTNHSYTWKIAKDVVCDTLDAINLRFGSNASFTGVPSGFSDLDNMTSGFQASELIIIGARPSMGKTAIALSMVETIAIKNKRPTAFFSLEMSGMQLMQRLLSSQSHISSEKIRSGLLKTSDFQNLATAAENIYDAPLYIIDTPNMKLLDLRAIARRLRAQANIEIIFIDYITLITSENTLIPRHEQIAEISRSLKSLARELNIPIVALSQVRRDSEGKAPTLADLRESGSIEQDADVVMFLHRERLPSVKDGKPVDSIDTQLIVAKQRNGPTGIVNIVFLPAYTKFENAAKNDSGY